VIKQLSVVTLAAASVAALIAAFTWPGEAQQRPRLQERGEAAASVEVASSNVRYDAGMRIIHVQPIGPSGYSDSGVADDVELPPPKATHTVMPAQPRRVLPPARSGPERNVVSAPPSLADGPTPIRPLPRWRSSEKFTTPPESAISDPVPADAVTATIPAESGPPAEETLPAIDDDAPPPAD
jgi:hypothetical protein